MSDQIHILIPATRRLEILDGIIARNIHWAGSGREPDLLLRIIDLRAPPSKDSRFFNAYDDIYQHTVANFDWESDWVFTDSRIGLLQREDAFFLDFLKIVLSPKTRASPEQQSELAEDFNGVLRSFGYRFVATRSVGPFSIYEAVRDSELGESMRLAHSLAEKLDAPYFFEEIERLSRLSSSGSPSELIGASKDLLETVALTIIEQRSATLPSKTDLSSRVKAALDTLDVVPGNVDDSRKASAAIKRIYSSMPNIVQGLAELRNSYGTGHGKTGSHSPLARRHAVLAVQTSVTLATFLVETHFFKDGKIGKPTP